MSLNIYKHTQMSLNMHKHIHVVKHTYVIKNIFYQLPCEVYRKLKLAASDVELFIGGQASQ
jgi:hypothetical protein